MQSFCLYILCVGIVAASNSCASHDDASDCAALVAFAKSTGYQGWHNNKGWLTGSSICTWYGIKCGSKQSLSAGKKAGGRVSEISLKSNNLKGSLPPQIGDLQSLTKLDLDGERPTNYMGCNGTDFGKVLILPFKLWLIFFLMTSGTHSSRAL